MFQWRETALEQFTGNKEEGVKVFANERVENASVKKWQFTRDMGRDPWAKGPAWVKGKG